MKQFPQLSRTKPAIPESLNRRLNSYALAAGAAGVSLLATAQPAEAEIVYTPVQVRILAGTTFQIDLNHDGTNDFFLYHNEHSKYGGVYRGGFLVLGGSASAAVIARRLYLEPSALPQGFPIGADSPRRFDQLRGQEALMANAFCYPLVPLDCQKNGPWMAATKKYVGLRFEINGETHYGWARLTVITRFSPPLHMVRAALTGYAYETEPNKTILAGDRGFGPEASTGTGHLDDANLKTDHAQQPLTLGLLSLGSLSRNAWRRPRRTSGNDFE